ncbi:MAG: hypothetical protein AAF733_09855 [Verrucomicrobiota bacterium]
MNPSKFILLALASAFLISCGEKEETGDAKQTSSAGESPLEAVFLSEEPSDAISVSEARGKANPGEELVVTGKIAGVVHPFTEGYATVVLGDVAMQTCDLKEDDECETPWDACCADPEEVQNQRMTIQVLAENGLPVAESLKGFKGLKELDVIVVSGTVNETSSEENLILDLSGIYQKESWN